MYLAGTGRDLFDFAGELKVEDGVFARLRKRLEEYYAGWPHDKVKCLAAEVESAWRSDAVTPQAVQAILGKVPPFIWKHFGLRGKGDDMQVTLCKVQNAVNFMDKFWESMKTDDKASLAGGKRTNLAKATSSSSIMTPKKAARRKRVVDNELLLTRRVMRKMCEAGSP